MKSLDKTFKRLREKEGSIADAKILERLKNQSNLSINNNSYKQRKQNTKFFG